MENILDKLSKKEFDKSLDAIKEEYDRVCAQVSSLRDTLDEYNKDEELQKKEETIEYLRTHALCFLSDKEVAANNAFVKKHHNLHNKENQRAVNNSIQYTLTGTGLGLIIEVSCPVCGEKLDITDISRW